MPCLADMLDVVTRHASDLGCAGWLQQRLLGLRARHSSVEGADQRSQHHQQRCTRQRQQAMHRLPSCILDQDGLAGVIAHTSSHYTQVVLSSSFLSRADPE